MENKRGTWLRKRNTTCLPFKANYSSGFDICGFTIVYDFLLHRIEKKIAQTNVKIEKMELDMKTKEDLKTVALGTSKINYLDPRITVAWCKRHEVPIEKVNSFCI